MFKPFAMFLLAVAAVAPTAYLHFATPPVHAVATPVATPVVQAPVAPPPAMAGTRDETGSWVVGDLVATTSGPAVVLTYPGYDPIRIDAVDGAYPGVSAYIYGVWRVGDHLVLSIAAQLSTGSDEVQNALVVDLKRREIRLLGVYYNGPGIGDAGTSPEVFISGGQRIIITSHGGREQNIVGHDGLL